MSTNGTAMRTDRAIDRLTAALRTTFVGRPRVAAVATVAAAALAGVVARRVASSGAYLRIEHAFPTYAGEVTGVFLLAGTALVALAAVAAALGGGVVPSVLLAGAPAFGWAVNHTAAPITPQYAATFPLEMGLLYGVVFGVVGYAVGRGLRRA